MFIERCCINGFGELTLGFLIRRVINGFGEFALELDGFSPRLVALPSPVGI